jgi:hypothetical protein
LKTRKFHIVGQLTAWGASWNFKSLEHYFIRK